jgi:hypothetical protein
MIGRRQWQILALIVMAVVGVGLGIWLFRTGFTCARLRLHRCVSVAWTAIRGLVHCSAHCPVRCHTAVEFNVAAPPPVTHLPPRCCGLRSRRLLVAVVARGMASWSCVRSFRVARLSPSDDQGDSTAQKGVHPIADSEVDRRSDTLNPTAVQRQLL